jgi:hypothetical protein
MALLTYPLAPIGGRRWLLLLLVAITIQSNTHAWRAQGPVLRTSLTRANNKNNNNEEEASFGLKAAWQATEWLGRAAGPFLKKNDGASSFSFSSSSSCASAEALDQGRPATMEEASRRLREDYDRDYFVSGLIDRELYDADCYFSDPFAGFNGRDRFIDNLQNLGGFITGADLKLIDYDESQLDAAIPVVTTKIMVKLQLGLPWNPVLAWPWGVRHEFDPTTCQITDHKESWDVSAAEGVAQCFRPASPAVLARIRKK